MSDHAGPHSVIVVAFGAAELLQHTLHALDRDERVYVVDNSSDADVRRVVMQTRATYDDPGENLGFARAVNRALARISTERPDDDVVLLNPDAVISSAQLSRAHSVFSEPGNARVGAVSPRLVSADGHEQQVMWPFPSPRAMWREALRLDDRRPQDGFAVGAVLLLRREALNQVGGFDERYFLYAEEADWQRRAVEHGWHTALASAVTAQHVGAATSVSSMRREQLFHAAQETYVRRWFGTPGWLSYRAAALLGALGRAVVGGPTTRRAARERVRLYARGPRLTADQAVPARITHVVVTGNRAGTERYVAQLAGHQAASGVDVSVIGGDPDFMKASLPSTARWLPGAWVGQAALSLVRLGRQDIVHTHLTNADLLAALLIPLHRARIVSTRHIAKPRGTRRSTTLAARLLQPWIAEEIAISQFVADAVNRPCRVIHNGVGASDVRPSLTTGRVLIAQRLEAEKQTHVALEAWCRAALGAQGWTLHVCGEGAEMDQLRRRFSCPSISWRGWVADMNAELESATALLASAPAEPCGLSVLEAMARGIPVIAADGGGHRETALDVEGALGFTPGDIEQCADRLRNIAASRTEELRTYGERLRSRQRAGFDEKAQLAKVTDRYHQVRGGIRS